MLAGSSAGCHINTGESPGRMRTTVEDDVVDYSTRALLSRDRVKFNVC